MLTWAISLTQLLSPDSLLLQNVSPGTIGLQQLDGQEFRVFWKCRLGSNRRATRVVSCFNRIFSGFAETRSFSPGCTEFARWERRSEWSGSAIGVRRQYGAGWRCL